MTTPSTVASRVYAIDPVHSNVQFAVRHLMISKVRGSFKTVSGVLALAGDSAIPTSITAEIDAASIDTRDAQRDAHLVSPDFLDAATHPKLIFTSTRIEPQDARHFHVVGDLELHGVKASVTLEAELTGRGKDPWGNDRVGYEATTRISRKDFGLVWNQALETGGVAVGDELSITLDIEAVAAPA